MTTAGSGEASGAMVALRRLAGNTALRILVFAAALLVAFALAFTLGHAVGPSTGGHEQSSTEHSSTDHSGTDHLTTRVPQVPGQHGDH